MEYGRQSFREEPEFDARQIIRSWQDEHPDWRTHASVPDSHYHPDHVRERRQQHCRYVAGLLTTGIHRAIVQKYGMKPDASRGALHAYVESVAITQRQQRMGMHMPFHREMESHLAAALESIDSHCGHLGTEITMHVEDWFETNIRQPIARAASRF